MAFLVSLALAHHSLVILLEMGAILRIRRAKAMLESVATLPIKQVILLALHLSSQIVHRKSLFSLLCV